MTEHNMAFVNPAPGIGGFEVSMNYVNAVEAFVEELTRRGKTKIALLADAIRADIEPDTRLIALRYFLEKKGLKFDESLLCCAQEGSVVPEATEFGYRATAHLLEARPDVEALFCMNDYIALGAYKCLNERGIPIPDRISVCGCDNDVMSGYMFPALSTMSVDKADFGRQCVRSILCPAEGGARRAKDHPVCLLHSQAVRLRKALFPDQFAKSPLPNGRGLFLFPDEKLPGIEAPIKSRGHFRNIAGGEVPGQSRGVGSGCGDKAFQSVFSGVWQLFSRIVL